MKSMVLKAGLVSVFAATMVLAVDPVEVWVRDYDSGVRDWAAGMVLDQDDNVYVFGNSLTGTDSADSKLFLLMKYTSLGDSVWLKTYNPGTSIFSYGMCIDLSGNIYTTGTCDTDFYTIKWDQGGNVIWEKAFDAPNSAASSVACDASGNIYVVGGRFVVVKYDSSGNVLWDRSNPSLTYAVVNSVAVGQDGSAYLGGLSLDRGLILKYDSSGSRIWNKEYDFVRWICSLAVDSDGYVYFTGPFGSEYDAGVCKLDSDGTVLWTTTYDAGGDFDSGVDVVIDEHFVYMLGEVTKGANTDLLIQRYQKDGTLDWTVTKNWNNYDKFAGIASDNKGSFYVSGMVGEDLKLLKYNQPDYPVSDIEEKTDLKAPISIEVENSTRSTVTLRYSLPPSPSSAPSSEPSLTTLFFYSSDGRLVDTYPLPASQTVFTWDASKLSSGVYFARLEAGNRTAAAKIVLAH